MDIQDNKLWKHAQAFLKECADKDVLIIHDYDVDGISGGLILAHTLRRLGARPTPFTKVGRGASLQHDTLKELPDADRIIITDQCPKSYGEYAHVRERYPDTQLMILDHHKLQTYDDALFVHPELVYGVKGHKYCSAKLIYDLCSTVRDCEDLSWLAAAGILGDANSPHFEEFLKEVCAYHDLDVPQDWYDAEFAQIAETIDCCAAAGEEELLRYVSDLKEHETLSGAVALGNPCQHIKDELDHYVELGMTLADNDGPVVWLPVESEYGIAGWATTILSFQHRHRLFVGYRHQVDGTSLNLRYQDANVHLGELIGELAPKFGGRGGGHAPAAGGWIAKGQFEAFQEAFTHAVQQALKQQE